MLPVNEIFETIQGEAAFTGTPSVFVRLQGCPVGCPWCDTKHTWEVNPAFEVRAATMMSKVDDAPTYSNMTTDQLLVAIKYFSARHIVLTGGEPCLYDLNELTAALIASGRTVQIETSGTHQVKAHPDTWVTVSPKQAMPGGYAVLDDALARANEIKHPVGKLKDIDNIAQSIAPKTPAGVHIWLQPLSQSEKATELCIREATQRNWRLSVQTHKYLGVR